jgi:hypothetical protein
MGTAAHSFRAASRRCCAMQIIVHDDGSVHMGLLTQIIPDDSIQVCGEGFNEKTVRVRLGREFYYMFREDLESAGLARGSAASN